LIEEIDRAKGKPRRHSEGDVQKHLAKVGRSISQLRRAAQLNDGLSITTIDQDVSISKAGREFERFQTDGAYAGMGVDLIMPRN